MSGINSINQLKNYRSSIGAQENKKTYQTQQAEKKFLEMLGSGQLKNTTTTPLTGKQLMVGVLAMSALGLTMMQGASAAPTPQGAGADGGIVNMHGGKTDGNYGLKYNKDINYRNPSKCLEMSKGRTYYFLRGYYDTCSTRNKCDFGIDVSYKITEGAYFRHHIPHHSSKLCPRNPDTRGRKAYDHLIEAKATFSAEKVREVRGRDNVNPRILLTTREAHDLVSRFRSDRKKNFCFQHFIDHFVAVSVSNPYERVNIKNFIWHTRDHCLVVELADLGGVDFKNGAYLVSKSMFDATL